MSAERTMMDECDTCRGRRSVPGNCHIRCATPDEDMTGNKHGIKEGWFFYPSLFDPTWKTKMCSNYEAEAEVSEPVGSDS